MWCKPHDFKIFWGLNGRLSTWELNKLRSVADGTTGQLSAGHSVHNGLYIIVRSPSQGNCQGCRGRSASREDKNAELQSRTNTRKIKEALVLPPGGIHQPSKEQEAMWLELQAAVADTQPDLRSYSFGVRAETGVTSAEGSWDLQWLVCPLLTGEGPAAKSRNTQQRTKTAPWLHNAVICHAFVTKETVGCATKRRSLRKFKGNFIKKTQFFSCSLYLNYAQVKTKMAYQNLQ